MDLWMEVGYKLSWWLLKPWALGLDLYVGRKPSVATEFAAEEPVVCWFLGGKWNRTRSRLQAEGLHAGVVQGAEPHCGPWKKLSARRGDVVRGRRKRLGQRLVVTPVAPVSSLSLLSVPYFQPFLPVPPIDPLFLSPSSGIITTV